MKGKTPRTPAQKLGLVDQVFSVHNILEFSPAKLFIEYSNITSKKVSY